MLKLKQIRLEKGLSVPALSRESGVPIRTIEDIERRGDCRISTAYKLAAALDITLSDLWVTANEKAEK
nr:MAG TPA: helix-turn-helix domain protein [Caudoviricetes sp.]